MKKILIISNGSIGERFIDRVIQTYTSDNIYYVVQTKAKEFEEASPARFKFYEFDPTSLYKLSNLLKMEFMEVVIALDSQVEVENTLKNIRTVKKQLRVIVLDQWDMHNEDANVVLVNAHDILSSRLLDYLPNVPVIAQNVGLGEGEIMEVLVPFGSSFVYKHIGVIEQKNWRIVAIYRNRELIIPSRRKMIHPNDLLLLVGQPDVLKSVYKAFKRELGQFPEPYGSHILLYIDMNIDKKKKIKDLVEKGLFIHEKLGHHLVIKVVNPSNIALLEYIKGYRSLHVDINIDYESINLKQRFLEDIAHYHAGLVMISSDMFRDYHVREALYEAHIPVLKIASKPLKTLKDAVLILSQNRDLEKISATIFDISQQMQLNLEIYNYIKEHQDEKEQVIEHYNNLSAIFSKTIKVYEEEENPLHTLQKKENFLHIVPFTQKLLTRRLYALFSTDSEKLYFKLDTYHQIFLPVQL